MKTTTELQNKINAFPEKQRELAMFLLTDLQHNALSKNQIEDRLKQEIRELVLEDMKNEIN